MPKGKKEKENHSQKEEFLPKMKENTTVPKTMYVSQDIASLH